VNNREQNISYKVNMSDRVFAIVNNALTPMENIITVNKDRNTFIHSLRKLDYTGPAVDFHMSGTACRLERRMLNPHQPMIAILGNMRCCIVHLNRVRLWDRGQWVQPPDHIIWVYFHYQTNSTDGQTIQYSTSSTLPGTSTNTVTPSVIIEVPNSPPGVNFMMRRNEQGMVIIIQGDTWGVVTDNTQVYR